MYLNHLSKKKKILAVLFLLLVALVIVAWVYYKAAFVPPPPRIYGTVGGPPITAPRIKLRDGRHLAYKENGVPKEKARFKIIYVHGYGGSRNDVDDFIKSNNTQEVVKELRVYILSFDRPGYGESDPHPERTTRTMALDVQDLADQMNLGHKFYLMTYSLGGQTGWSCLNYIPFRLAGAALLTPAINYWWEDFPTTIAEDAFRQQRRRDQWAERVAHYTPWLTYWWNTQTFFPHFSLAPKKRDQGDYESLYRDINVAFRSWGFSPPDILEPSETRAAGSFHLWQGDADGIVPVTMQRYIAKSLPWIRYHEVAGGGHDFGYKDGMPEKILNRFLLGQTSEDDNMEVVG